MQHAVAEERKLRIAASSYSFCLLFFCASCSCLWLRTFIRGRRRLITMMASSALSAPHLGYGFSGLMFLNSILVVSLRNCFLQKSDFQCSHPNRLPPSSRIYAVARDELSRVMLEAVYDCNLRPMSKPLSKRQRNYSPCLMLTLSGRVQDYSSRQGVSGSFSFSTIQLRNPFSLQIESRKLSLPFCTVQLQPSTPIS